MLRKMINRYRLFSRSFLMSLISIPYGLSWHKMRLQLLGWCLCRRHQRYRIGNIFFKKKGLLDTCCYGETPWITLHRIAKKINIHDKTCVMDLGSGVGLATLWLSIHTGCRIIGVEANEQLLVLANRLASACRLADRVTFLQEDMFTLPYQKVDVIYIYHSALDDISIKRLGEQLMQYDSRVQIITITYSFVEVLPDHFELTSCFEGWFPWGITGIYVQHTKKKIDVL
ncbi:MAG: class I SAM-dependent methyltransferase [Endozoicomonadaceae bacterium]|nr:class I SAM-dependent methyltransferase [Endozoicomonadaceae bacterium]MBE8233692.1 class I SAM-dependent methyltransferase [Endozoicomonadaceae bacterium]